MRVHPFLVLIASVFVISCADDVVKKTSTPSGFNNTTQTNNADSNNGASNNASNNSNNTQTNTSNNLTLNNPDPEFCGNGVLDEGEACDPAIQSGAGVCPSSCQTQDSCLQLELRGSAGECTAQCVATTITQCVNGDGCCAAGCTFETDNDCSPTCGNGVVDAGETCDGNCPSQCTPSSACATASLAGSAASCTAICTETQITQCSSGDGCCPAGCTFANDNDCSCTPRTCTASQCGTIDNGCGGTVNCGGCGAGEACSGNQCVPTTTNLPVGSPCTSHSQCSGNTPNCITDPDFHQGYCSANCQFDNDCPSGSHCGYKDQNGLGVCLKNCSNNSDCRTNYSCHNDDASQDNSRECAPYGAGSRSIGSPCTGVYQCSGGDDALCLRGTSWPGGYCSLECTSLIFLGDSCPSGNRCYTEFSQDGFCVEECTFNSECRQNEGYQCLEGFTIISDPYNACLK